MSDPFQRPQAPPPPTPAHGSGGTEGGVGMFFTGFLLSLASLWFFFDSVRMTSGHGGVLGRRIGRALGGGGGGHGGGDFTTTSMGLIFLPLFIGLIMLFNNARNKLGWAVFLAGIAILVIEMISMVRFEMNMKTSSFILLMVVFAAGVGLMLRSYKSFSTSLNDQGRGGPGNRSSGL